MVFRYYTRYMYDNGELKLGFEREPGALTIWRTIPYLTASYNENVTEFNSKWGNIPAEYMNVIRGISNSIGTIETPTGTFLSNPDLEQPKPNTALNPNISMPLIIGVALLLMVVIWRK